MLATEEKVKRKAHLKRPLLAGRRTIGELQIWMTIQIHLKRTGRSRCLILSNCRDWSLIASVVRWHHRLPTWKTWMCAKHWKTLKTPINESLQVLSGETAWVLSDHLAAEPGDQMKLKNRCLERWNDMGGLQVNFLYKLVSKWRFWTTRRSRWSFILFISNLSTSDILTITIYKGACATVRVGRT